MKENSFIKAIFGLLMLTVLVISPCAEKLMADELRAIKELIDQEMQSLGLSEPFHEEVLTGDSSANCEGAESLDMVVEGPGESGGRFGPAKVPEGENVTICVECVDNTNGDKIHGPDKKPTHTRDDCAIDANGATCGKDEAGAKLCCDFTDKARSDCKCNTYEEGVCQKPEDCEDCMAAAEFGTATLPSACQIAGRCVMINRLAIEQEEAEKKGEPKPDMCDSIRMKKGKQKNAPAYDSIKCICDRTSPSPNTGYNQKYCECCEALARGETTPEYDGVKDQDLTKEDCDKMGFGDLTAFSSGNTALWCGNSNIVNVPGCPQATMKFGDCPYP